MTVTPQARYDHYINGDFRPSADAATYSGLDPATGATIYQAAAGGAADVDAAVASANAALHARAWRELAPSARGHILRRVAGLIATRAEHLARLETLDSGKVIREVRAQNQKAIDFFEYFGGLADKIQGAVIPLEPGTLVYTLREPVGVIAAIVPWNSPLLLAAYKLAPALAAGNTVVIKPSEHTPVSLLETMSLFEEAGFPPGVVNVVTGFADVGAALAQHPGVHKVSFTGSTETGRKVAHAAVDHFADIILELGGKSPQLVLPDADPDQVVAGLAAGIFAAGGQTCIAGSRAYISASVYDEVVEKLIARAQAIRIGDPLEEDTELGPLCFEAHRARVEQLVERGVADGASLLTGGSRPPRDGWFYMPTVFGDVHDTMEIARDEIFGPVLSVLRWEDEEELIRRANESPYGLAAGVWTRDVTRAHRIAACLDVGTVWINKYRSTSPLVPVGGFKASGIGKESGIGVMNEYTRVKAIWVDTHDEANGGQPGARPHQSS